MNPQARRLLLAAIKARLSGVRLRLQVGEPCECSHPDTGEFGIQIQIWVRGSIRKDSPLISEEENQSQLLETLDSIADHLRLEGLGVQESCAVEPKKGHHWTGSVTLFKPIKDRKKKSDS